MNARHLRAGLIAACLCFAASHLANAQQGRGPGGPPPGPRGGPGGGAPSGPPPSNGSPNTQSLSSATANSTGTARGGLQFGPPGRWWDDHSITSSIGLRPSQQKSMDAIFDANKGAIVSSYTTLMTQQSRLDALNKQSNVDSKTLFAAIDAVNQARASLQKATSEMLLQIRSKMDAEQIEKLQNLH